MDLGVRWCRPGPALTQGTVLSGKSCCPRSQARLGHGKRGVAAELPSPETRAMKLHQVQGWLGTQKTCVAQGYRPFCYTPCERCRTTLFSGKQADCTIYS